MPPQNARQGYVELEVEVGTIRLRSSEISRIERFSEAENRAMLKEWEEHKIKADIARRHGSRQRPRVKNRS